MALVDAYRQSNQQIPVGSSHQYPKGLRVDHLHKVRTSCVGADARHFASHCKMAPLIAGGVVDGDTRVYVTTNCFVADNSICREIPDINTTASAIMIGLRSSEIIKGVQLDGKIKDFPRKKVL